MLNVSARLLRLLSLLQSRRDWSGGALAERLDVSARTVRRDVDKLRLLGYPIEAIGGVGGGYRLAAGAALPPLLLDDDEAVAVAVSLRTAAALAVTGIEETSVRALAKVDQVLPARLRHRVNAFGAAVVTLPASGPTVDPTILTAVAAAVRDRERLRFDYVARDGSTSRRDVEPYRIVHSGRRWYLYGWDVQAADWRTFRADRLSPRVPAGPRFRPRPLPADDVAVHVALGMTSRQYRHQAVLTMYAPADAVAEEVPPTLGVIERIDEHTCTLRIGSDNLDQLAVWVAAFGFEFAVREPAELRAHVDTLAARLGRAASRRTARPAVRPGSDLSSPGTRAV
ncbi:YafY family protein [Micromonospora sp. KC721]|uniref:helix-turn-helix transcriptional regulator n=1 Tax=Micromonospora sp. KC721 TaxID=2530380 RepID=UPI00104C3C09|nr:YafY family protein [Micromonospora sp. KC721]TDB81941.1 YafY family transcriptional regulator [Micromonospora sp. KC721]